MLLLHTMASSKQVSRAITQVNDDFLSFGDMLVSKAAQAILERQRPLFIAGQEKLMSFVHNAQLCL